MLKLRALGREDLDGTVSLNSACPIPPSKEVIHTRLGPYKVEDTPCIVLDLPLSLSVDHPASSGSESLLR